MLHSESEDAGAAPPKSVSLSHYRLSSERRREQWGRSGIAHSLPVLFFLLDMQRAVGPELLGIEGQQRAAPENG